MEEMVKEILQTLNDFRKENEERWKENEKRWEENERRWKENDKRWKKTEERLTRIEENGKQTEERLTRIEENGKQTEERLTRIEENGKQTEQRLTKIEGNREGDKKEFFRLYDIIDKNFSKVFKEIEEIKERLPEEGFEEKLELRLQKLEANQRYYERVQEMHDNTLYRHTNRINKIRKTTDKLLEKKAS